MKIKLLKKLRKKANREIDANFRIVEVKKGKYAIAESVYSSWCPDCNPKTDYWFLDDPVPKKEAIRFINWEKRKFILSLAKQIRMKRTLPNPQI